MAVTAHPIEAIFTDNAPGPQPTSRTACPAVHLVKIQSCTLRLTPFVRTVNPASYWLGSCSSMRMYATATGSSRPRLHSNCLYDQKDKRGKKGDYYFRPYNGPYVAQAR